MTLTNTPEILVYGGAFNPPTVAHQAVIERCLEIYPDNELWIMPSGQRQDKRISVDDTHRLEMLAIVLGQLTNANRAHVIRIEMDDPVTQTWRTVARLHQSYPDQRFRFLFGADSYHSMSSWRHGKLIQGLLPIIVIQRDGSPPVQADNVQNLISQVERDISSSRVRQAIKAGSLLEGLAIPEIADYIRRHGLYS